MTISPSISVSEEVELEQVHSPLGMLPGLGHESPKTNFRWTTYPYSYLSMPQSTCMLVFSFFDIMDVGSNQETFGLYNRS